MFRNLFTLMAPQGKALLLVVVIGGVASLSTVGLMALAGWLIASAALMPPLYTLSLAITGVRFCGIFRAVFRYLERLLSHKVGFAFFNLYRQRVMESMVQLVPFRLAVDQGNLYYVMVDAVDKMRDAFLRFFLPPLTALLTGVVVAVFFSYFNFVLALWLVALIIIFLGLLPWWARGLYCGIDIKQESLTQEIMEMYTGNMEMAVYGYTNTKLAKSEAIVQGYQSNSQLVNKVKAKVNFVTELVGGLSLVATIMLIMYLYNLGEINGVICVTVMLGVQALLDIYGTVPGLMQWVWESEGAYRLLTKYLHQPVEDEQELVVLDYENGPHLASKALSFGYGVEDLLLKDINLAVEKGDKVLVLGPSGTGKSTLCYVLTKLLPYQGSIGFENIDYSLWSPEELRKYFAPSFQEHHIFAGTVRENFQLLHPGIKDEEILHCLQVVGSTIFTKLEDLDRLVVDNGGNLSGGQRHGLQLAMVLAKARDVILLDEPTAGLDLQTASHLLQTVMKDYGQHTIIVASHDLSMIKYFNKVLILGNHTVVEQGAIEELLQDSSSELNKLMKYKNLL